MRLFLTASFLTALKDLFGPKGLIGRQEAFMDNTCPDPGKMEKTKDLHVLIPMRLAKRVRAYASENCTTITNVVIEALDSFLREYEK